MTGEAWTAKDGELAAAVWLKLSGPAQNLFAVLIDNPETKFSGDELAKLLGIRKGKRAIAGLLSWPERHCRHVDREFPWNWEYPPKKDRAAVYWFTDVAADLFRQARGQASRP